MNNINNTTDKRVEYVRIAIRILEEEGIEALSIRRVAKEAGCTSAVLYRHFENKEHLLMIAAVKFLTPYIQQFIPQYKRTDISYIQKDLINWRIFINESFHNKTYYAMFFCGEQKTAIVESMFEYYELFPAERKKFDGLAASITLNNDLEERCQLGLRSAANWGLITFENAATLSKLTAAVFYGKFSQLTSDPDKIQAQADECYQLIYELFRRYVKPGTVLDADSQSSDR